MGENAQRRMLYVAAAWNVLGGVSSLLDPGSHFAQMYRGSLDLGDPVQRFFYQSVWIAVIAWGAAYLGAALVPAARKVVVAAGGAGKLAYFGACLALFHEGTGTAALLGAGLADLAFAAVFAQMAFARGFAGAPRMA